MLSVKEGRTVAASSFDGPGVATLGAAGVEVAQSVLAETQSAILPLVPYLDTLRWVFIAVALGGSRSRSTLGSTTGSGGSDDRRTRRDAYWIGVGAHGAPLRRHRTGDPSVPPDMLASAAEKIERLVDQAGYRPPATDLRPKGCVRHCSGCSFPIGIIDDEAPS
tara:strand:- start:159 stop:650 length:492 start_codon:yes stop_codon:yes gene_type:complete